MCCVESTKMKLFIVVAFVLGVAMQVYGDDLDLDIDLPPVEQSLPAIPGLDRLPINISITQLTEATEKADAIMREKCVRNGGEIAYEVQAQGRSDFIDCVKNLFNVSYILEEVEKHKYTGDLEIVFRKECGKREILMNCVSNFTESMDRCLDPEEKSNKVLLNNVTTQLINFICHKEGDRIALFIAEKGPECLKDKQSAMLGCINSTYPRVFEGGALDLHSLPNLVVTTNHCADVDAVQCCIVRELEGCDESTPANVIESVMKFVRKATPCNSNLNCVVANAANDSIRSIPLVILCFSMLRWLLA